MDNITTIKAYKKTRDRLVNHQRSKRLRTQDDAINDLLDNYSDVDHDGYDQNQDEHQLTN